MFATVTRTLSLRLRVAIAILVPLAVALLILTFTEYRQHLAAQQEAAALMAANAGRLLEADIRERLQQSDLAGIHRQMATLTDGDEYRNAFLLDTSGGVIASARAQGAGDVLDYDALTCRSCHVAGSGERPSRVVVSAANGEQMLRAIFPLRNTAECAECHESRQATLALLIADIPLGPFQDQLETNLWAHVLWWLASFGTIFGGVFLMLKRQVVDRLGHLSRAMNTYDPERFTPLSEGPHSDEIAHLYHSFNEMARQVQTEDRRRRQLAVRHNGENIQRAEFLKRLIVVQENERKRIAAELHDELGQVLTGISLQLAVIRQTVARQPEQSLAQLEEVQSHVSFGIERMYEVIVALRPPELDDLGLLAALCGLAERMLRETGIDYEFDCSQVNGRFPQALETALYRIYQEALSNIVRHSQADHVSMVLARHASVLKGEIIDNGRGFDPTSLSMNGTHPRGLGLLGMQERISQCGGQIEIDSAPGQGTRICLHVAIMEAKGERSD